MPSAVEKSAPAEQRSKVKSLLLLILPVLCGLRWTRQWPTRTRTISLADLWHLRSRFDWWKWGYRVSRFFRVTWCFDELGRK